MTVEEAKQIFDMYRKQGYTDEQILKILFKMYRDSVLTYNDFEGLADVLGFEFTEIFKNLSDEKRKSYDFCSSTIYTNYKKKENIKNKTFTYKTK